MNEQIQQKGRIRVFACGGCAINIASIIASFYQDPCSIADIDVVMLDTSRANLDAATTKYEHYLIEGVDGSGKIRKENSAIISEKILDIMLKHKPADLNIVLSSGGGGSGSVLGPLITKELLGRKIPVVVFTVGGTSSKLEAQNTVNTLKTYEAISQQTNAPVIMSYRQNSTITPRRDVNMLVITDIYYLAILYSKKNKELDTRDLHNWLRYNDGPTSFPPRLSALTIISREPNNKLAIDEIKQLGNIISVATLAEDGVGTDFPVTPEYSTTGIMPELDTSGSGASVNKGQILNYIISDGGISNIYSGLSSFTSELESITAARSNSKSLLSASDKPNENGLVL